MPNLTGAVLVQLLLWALQSQVQAPPRAQSLERPWCLGCRRLALNCHTAALLNPPRQSGFCPRLRLALALSPR